MVRLIVTTLLLLGVQFIHAQIITSAQQIRPVLTENVWTNGFEFVSCLSPDKYERMGIHDVSVTDKNTLIFMGGTLHEFGTNLYFKQMGDEFFLDENREYQLFPAGSRVSLVADDNALVFRHPSSGELVGVLKILSENSGLRGQMEQDLFVYGLMGTYFVEDDPTKLASFSELYTIDSPLFKDKTYSFGVEYDYPHKILHIGDDIYGFKREMHQLELFPLKYNSDSGYYYQAKGGRRITLNRVDKMKALDYPNLSACILTQEQLMLYAGHHPYEMGVASQKSEIRQMLYSFSVMRNQIFAQMGYIFKKKEWRDYFSLMPWYKPESVDVTQQLTEIQKINIEHIQLLEKKWKKELETASAGNIEKTNLSLIQSEMKVPESERELLRKTKKEMKVEVDKGTAYVTNEREFLDALTNGADIVLKEGTNLNLSNILYDMEYFDTDSRRFMEDASGIQDAPTTQLISESVFNGRQLTIINLRDVTIRGEKNTAILVEPLYAYVLNFVNCHNITLENLTLGHVEEGFCTGGVVGLTACAEVKINQCDMFGCGAYGIVAEKTDKLYVSQSIIRDCSYGIMEIRGGEVIKFDQCDFIRNEKFTMVYINELARGVSFYDCRFAQNKGVLFELETMIQIENCEIHHADETTFGTENMIEYLGKRNRIFIDDNPLPERNIGPDCRN